MVFLYKNLNLHTFCYLKIDQFLTYEDLLKIIKTFYKIILSAKNDSLSKNSLGVIPNPSASIIMVFN